MSARQSLPSVSLPMAVLLRMQRRPRRQTQPCIHQVDLANLGTLPKALTQVHSVSASSLESLRRRVLASFRDVFPEELPSGLPPSREVDHDRADPGATPPSRPTFRLSATELDELKKQLEELVKLPASSSRASRRSVRRSCS